MKSLFASAEGVWIAILHAAHEPVCPHYLNGVELSILSQLRKPQGAVTRVAHLGVFRVPCLLRLAKGELQRGGYCCAARRLAELPRQQTECCAHPAVVDDAVVAKQAVDLDGPPFMGNPIPGATTPPPVTVTMARYVPLNIRYTFAMLGQANICETPVACSVRSRDATPRACWWRHGRWRGERAVSRSC